jgi:hypothetical protein
VERRVLCVHPNLPGFHPDAAESIVLIFGREILVIGTTALTPSLGVEVTGVESLLDDTPISRCLVMWDKTGLLHRALPYDPSSERTMHRTTIFGDEALS